MDMTQIRMECLQMAIASLPEGVGEHMVLDAAKEFEAYVLGKKSKLSVIANDEVKS